MNDPTASLSADQILALDEKINTLNSDIANEAAAGNAKAVSFSAFPWASFFARWKGWFVEHGAGTGIMGKPLDFFSDSTIIAQFSGFTGEYNADLDKANALGIKTTATKGSVMGGAGDTANTVVKVGITVGALYILYKIFSDD